MHEHSRRPGARRPPSFGVRALTVVELLVVLVILGTLAAVIVWAAR